MSGRSSLRRPALSFFLHHRTHHRETRLHRAGRPRCRRCASPATAVGVDRGAGEIEFNLSYGDAVVPASVLLLISRSWHSAHCSWFADEYRPTTRPSDGTGLHTTFGFLAAISPLACSADRIVQLCVTAGKAPITVAAANGDASRSDQHLAASCGGGWNALRDRPELSRHQHREEGVHGGRPRAVIGMVEAGPTGWAPRSRADSVVSVKAFDHVQRNRSWKPSRT